MKLYLGPTSSLELVRYLRSANGADGLEGTAVRKKTLNDAINTVKGVKELDISAQLLLEHVSKPIHAFVGSHEKGTTTKYLVTHLSNQQVPNGAFINIGHGIYICTPQFAFLQLGATMDFLELVVTGMELCGSYSTWRLDTGESALTGINGRQSAPSCTYGLPPAITAKRLSNFVERMQGWRGAVGARKAIRWIIDGSASPMETATYLLLCLPRRLGGYGLPKPMLNPLLKISGPDGVKQRFPDLFWIGANIDVEYNSDEDHSGEWARYRDSKRVIELAGAEIRVLPLTRPQLMNTREFDSFAHSLRRMLGVRSRPVDAGWTLKRDELRRFLLFG